MDSRDCDHDSATRRVALVPLLILRTLLTGLCVLLFILGSVLQTIGFFAISGVSKLGPATTAVRRPSDSVRTLPALLQMK